MIDTEVPNPTEEQLSARDVEVAHPVRALEATKRLINAELWTTADVDVNRLNYCPTRQRLGAATKHGEVIFADQFGSLSRWHQIDSDGRTPAPATQWDIAETGFYHWPDLLRFFAASGELTKASVGKLKKNGHWTLTTGPSLTDADPLTANALNDHLTAEGLIVDRPGGYSNSQIFNWVKARNKAIEADNDRIDDPKLFPAPTWIETPAPWPARRERRWPLWHLPVVTDWLFSR